MRWKSTYGGLKPEKFLFFRGVTKCLVSSNKVLTFTFADILAGASSVINTGRLHFVFTFFVR